MKVAIEHEMKGERKAEEIQAREFWNFIFNFKLRLKVLECWKPHPLQTVNEWRVHIWLKPKKINGRVDATWNFKGFLSKRVEMKSGWKEKMVVGKNLKSTFYL